MLLSRSEREHIARHGRLCAIRRWRRPTVKSGGTLRSPVGVLAVERVCEVMPGELTQADARHAGHATLADLLAALGKHAEGTCYRIEMRLAGPDPRDALREQTRFDAAAVTAALQRLDRRGAWTRQYLALIDANPGRRSAELAAMQNVDQVVFKRNVRKLKDLGLTESLEVGYRLSPRGSVMLAALQSDSTPDSD